MTEWTVNNKLNAWYQKQYHIKLPKQYETKSLLYFSTYSPISLFETGEQGAWFDPSDLSTMFQDTAGTNPVTDTGQSVGLMLDKSKGLVLGSELRATGVVGIAGTATAATYNTTTGAGSVSRAGDASNQSFVTFGSLTSALYYRMVVANTGSASLLVRSNNSTGAILQTITAGSSVTFFSSGNTALVVTPLTNATTVTFTMSALATTPGNHATQATTAAQPIYGIHPVGGRRNLLERTEDFTVSPWAAAALGTSTRTNTTTPYSFGLGLITVTSANGGIRQSRTGLISGQPYTLSFYLESATPNINVVFENGAANFGAVHVVSIDPSTGVFSGVSGFTSTSSVVFGTGRIYTLVSAPAGGSLIANIEWRVTAASGSFLLGRPQFELGSTATAYQRVTDQYNVTEAGVSSVSYLFFDGASDSLATPTITPGVDKVQVFAGVRKLANAVGIIAELGAASGNGLAAVYGNASNNYGVVSKGTLQATVVSPQNATVPPITNVVTGIGDISGDTTAIRVNGSQVATSSTDQGTGNYLAYPLYIGARAGASLFFSGHLYSLIARFGPNLTADQLSSTETWVASKTGITI